MVALVLWGLVSSSLSRLFVVPLLVIKGLDFLLGGRCSLRRWSPFSLVVRYCWVDATKCYNPLLFGLYLQQVTDSLLTIIACLPDCCCDS